MHVFQGTWYVPCTAGTYTAAFAVGLLSCHSAEVPVGAPLPCRILFLLLCA